MNIKKLMSIVSLSMLTLFSATLLMEYDVSADQEIKESKKFKVVEDHTPGKKIDLAEVKKNIDFVTPKYIPLNLILGAVILNEPPATIKDDELRDTLKTYEII